MRGSCSIYFVPSEKENNHGLISDGSLVWLNFMLANLFNVAIFCYLN